MEINHHYIKFHWTAQLSLFIKSWEFLTPGGWGVAWVGLLFLNYQGGRFL